jgi:hypothetical protein
MPAQPAPQKQNDACRGCRRHENCLERFFHFARILPRPDSKVVREFMHNKSNQYRPLKFEPVQAVINVTYILKDLTRTSRLNCELSTNQPGSNLQVFI